MSGRAVTCAALAALLLLCPGAARRAAGSAPLRSAAQQQEQPAAQEEAGAPRVACAYAVGGVVRAELAGAAAEAYCFTSVPRAPAEDSPDWMACGGARQLAVFKVDGDYYLWLRGTNGSVSEPYAVQVRSGFQYVVRAEGLTALTTPLADFLAGEGSSVEALNAAIAQDVAAAGLYTRCGVVTAGVSLVSRLAGYGVSATYQGHGAYQDEDDWGVNPDWGARLANPTSDGNGTYYYTGMQCVAAIVWAYKQAGVNLSNAGAGSHIGACGEREKAGDNRIAYDAARGGDIVQNGGHYLMVVDRLDTDGDGADDSYLTYEMNAPHLAFLVLTFRQVRYRTFYDMEAVFEDAGRLRDEARFWPGSYFIPQEALPAWLSDAQAAGGQRRALSRLLCALGLPAEGAA